MNDQPQNQLTKGERIAEKINPDMTLTIAAGEHGELAFVNLAQIMEVAKVMAIAKEAIPGHLRDNVGACLAVCIQASEWQMSPFAVANKTYVVKDRMAFEAQLINAVILRRAPLASRFKIEYRGEGQARRCKVSVKVKEGNDVEVVEYESPEIGKIPVQNSPLWKGDPDQQLFYYSSRAMCRRHFPDVLLGVYTPEELAEEAIIRDVTPIPGRPAIGPEREPETPAGKAEPDPKAVQGKPQPEQKPAKKGKAPAGNAEGGAASDKDGAKTPTPPQTGTTEETQPEQVTEEQRRAMVDEVNEMRDTAHIEMKDFKARADEMGIAKASELLIKYTPAQLAEVKERWAEFVTPKMPAEESAK